MDVILADIPIIMYIHKLTFPNVEANFNILGQMNLRKSGTIVKKEIKIISEMNFPLSIHPRSPIYFIKFINLY